MVSSTIELRGPKRLIRRMYKLAKREHGRGHAFCGLFEEASRGKHGGDHSLLLSRHGYLPLGAARRELAPVLDAAARKEGIENVGQVVHLEPVRSSGWGGLSGF